MPKPEEVLVVEDENGEIIREVIKDTDSIILYKSMRQTLIYLTNLDHHDTQQIMLEKLTNQVYGRRTCVALSHEHHITLLYFRSTAPTGRGTT
jgi:protease II